MRISSNGVQLNVSEHDGGEIALVFLHYWGGSARTWNAVTGFLVEGVVRELGLNRYYLVGHSMGAKIAQVLASRKPKGLEGLILVAGASPTPSTIPLERRNAMVHVYDSRESILGAINNVLTSKKLTAKVQEQVIEDSFKGGKEQNMPGPPREW
jgi:pimeloyl-ACP methyl ester carboxylesterase